MSLDSLANGAARGPDPERSERDRGGRHQPPERRSSSPADADRSDADRSDADRSDADRSDADRPDVDGSGIDRSGAPESTPSGAQRVDGRDSGGERITSFRLLALMVGSIAGWGLLMQRFGGNIYAIMGPYALSVSAVIAALSTHDLRRWLRPTPLAVSSGIAVGVVMTLLTYPLFSLAQLVVPTLGSAVSALYSTAHRASIAEALPWVLVIIVAEELLWRGALLHVLARRVPDSIAMALSVLSYALAQFGTGSWIVMLLALVCGTIWTLQRRFTHSLLSPLISHLIWTPVVILFHPVAPG